MENGLLLWDESVIISALKENARGAERIEGWLILVTEKNCQAGEIIFKKGDIAKSFFQILEGSVEVVLENESGEQILTELADGKFFGEMGLLDYVPRSATVRAGQGGAKVLEIHDEETNVWLREHPEMILQLMKHISSRTRALTKEYDDAWKLLQELRGGAEKNQGMLKRLSRFVSFHRSRKGAERESVESKSRTEAGTLKEGYTRKVNEYPAGTVIFREGEKAHCMYGIHGGRIGIYTGYGTDQQKKLADVYADQFFGEMGMIDDEPRSATAVAEEDGTMLERIEPEDLAEMSKQNPGKLWMIFLHLMDRLRSLTRDFEKVCAELSELQA